MDTSKRVFINTIAQYVKAFVNTCLSLYTVRLVLAAMGQSDYGIYSLVAGVVGMLGFVINSMSMTTQRFLSFYMGKGDLAKQGKVFSNSLILQFVCGVAMFAIAMSFRTYLCSHFLNIADERREATALVYIMVAVTLLFSFVSTPFKATLIAHENIVFISIIEMAEGVLKLVLALTLLSPSSDNLVVFSLIILSLYTLELLAYSSFCLARYGECRIKGVAADFEWETIKELGGFAQWTTLGMGAIFLRTQGFSLLINRFFGTILNAAYGIAMQMFGAVSFISSSVVNALNPVLMKAEGRNDHGRMLEIAEKESRFVVGMMVVAFVPVMVEMEGILRFWLKEVPPCAPFFCRCLLLSFLIDQTTYGLHSANQAMGHIRNYTLLMYTPKILLLPLAYAILKMGGSIRAAMCCYVLVELLVALMRIPYISMTAGLSARGYFKRVVWRVAPLALFTLALSFAISQATFPYRFLPNMALTCLAGGLFAWVSVLTKDERETIRHIVTNRKK